MVSCPCGAAVGKPCKDLKRTYVHFSRRLKSLLKFGGSIWQQINEKGA